MYIWLLSKFWLLVFCQIYTVKHRTKSQYGQQWLLIKAWGTTIYGKSLYPSSTYISRYHFTGHARKLTVYTYHILICSLYNHPFLVIHSDHKCILGRKMATVTGSYKHRAFVVDIVDGDVHISGCRPDEKINQLLRARHDWPNPRKLTDFYSGLKLVLQ